MKIDVLLSVVSDWKIATGSKYLFVSAVESRQP